MQLGPIRDSSMIANGRKRNLKKEDVRGSLDRDTWDPFRSGSEKGGPEKDFSYSPLSGDQ